MSKLNIDQKSIKDLFSDNKADFLIPDYQRPYAWQEKECQTLWDDIFTFAFPDNDYTKFNSSNDEYFLGPIVTFKNEEKKQEIIDGQQRLTTLMLLLRAFYERYGSMMDQQSIKTKEMIEKCIWKTDEFGNPNMSDLKIDSEVATDDEKEQFLRILRTGIADDNDKSNYATNYRFFRGKIAEFLNTFPGYFSYLPIRILNNCILLPIEAESQDTALRIFSTLNDRGKPLSDADIFKAQFYKFYAKQNRKDEFIAKWKDLEVLCTNYFHPISGTPMDELFTRYMYYERAKMGNKNTTTEALRKFFERNSYALLKKEETFNNLIDLANFWKAVLDEDVDKFSEEALRRLFVLNYAPNGMWTYAVTVYYLVNRNEEDMLDDAEFCKFLDVIIAFIWTYALTNPGVNALRTPMYAELVNIYEGKKVEFVDFKFDKQHVINVWNNYIFSNIRAITKSILTWWAMQDVNQARPSLERKFEIEHIFARNRQVNERSLQDPRNLETLGNKALLEKKINIRAADYRFADKKKYYEGFVNGRGQTKDGTMIHELVCLAQTATDFTEADIKERSLKIQTAFIAFLQLHNLLK